MVKPYFAKYLPVKGELEIGDLYLNKAGELHYYQDSFPKYHYIGAKKVKLFLCSRDIKVGDKFIIPDDYMLDPDLWVNNIVEATSFNEDNTVIHFKAPCTVGGNIHSGVLRTDNPYKVIGEISSEATWVKEDDEFEENKIAWISDDGEEYKFSIIDMRKDYESTGDCMIPVVGCTQGNFVPKIL